jgi:hypothetical protein|uniref:LIM zinc-binding domain-containing protein n=1 Tax=Eutreptiella gymnastica TaxID=73025 RepID=A0A7S4GGS0_9EUGL|mmetsp:Transcript_91500/g.153306  ORF Transcript_91500/g.153306 Transcript_91500/m.153306 type:complete len:146 (-) Transcript_91500:327-764(-)
MPECSRCNQDIQGGHVEALGRPWHTDCFTCAVCSTPFGQGTFVVHNKKPMHQQCYDKVREPVCCRACCQEILRGDIYLEALGGMWHVSCFKCARCGKDFVDGKYFADDTNTHPIHDSCEQHTVVGHVAAASAITVEEDHAQRSVS